MKKLTIGIIAHVDSGKTTLSEALLYTSGKIRNFGRVDKGESFLDSDAIERRRGITVFSKQASYDYGDTSFILLDTPGHSDFSAEMERTLQVLDYCVLLISASDGIKGQTETLWRLLEEYNIPTFIFFNKMDQDGADRYNLLTRVHATLSDNIVSFDKKDINEFYDSVAMCSEEAMEMYLENETVSDECIRNLILSRNIFPCFFGSALKMEGIENLLEGMDKYTCEPHYSADFGARAYKITHDNGVRLTLMKITGGSLKTKDIIRDGSEDTKVNQIRIYEGHRFSLVTEVVAGDICAIEGLKNSHAGDGYGTEAKEIIPILMPVLKNRVLFPPGCDPARELINFRILEEESPELSVSWDEEHHELYISVMGDVQLEIIHENYLSRFGIDISFDAGEVLYCETIDEPVIGVGHFEPLRHYAEVHLRMEPLPEGSGLVFDTEVSTDELAKNWQRLIVTHLYEKVHRGVLTGAPITDMKITLIAGRAHPKHTEGGDFRQATYRAIRQGLMMTKSRLLEPYYRFRISLPTENLGRAMTDLDAMHASLNAPENDNQTGYSYLMGRVPVSAFVNYPKQLMAYSKGLGHVEVTPDGYGECFDEQNVIAQSGYDPCRDLRNTPDSVFCAHGAGFVVPYNEVYDYMHIPFDKKDAYSTALLDEQFSESRSKSEEIFLGIEEIDEIISKISGANSVYTKKPGWKKSRRRSSAGNNAASKASSKSVTRVFDKNDTEYLLVDGYNVIFAWQELKELADVNLDSAKDSLLDTMSAFQGVAGCEIIVVFDAYKVVGHKTEILDYNGIHVVYTREAETADQYIEKFTHEHASKYNVTVVTSDGLEQIIIRGEGAGLISSREFKGYIENRMNQFRAKYNIQ